ncbi:MAG TPA: hypothetical protein VK666_13195 [Chryseolinea sp.]|nr:hypothetical protein [Chryseolinea sp.]
MKVLLTAFLFLFSNVSFSQVAVNGRTSNDSLILENGAVFIKGSSVSIGKGSKGDGSYSFLFVAPKKMLGMVSMPIPLTAGWAGYKMKVTDFKKSGTATMGYKYYLVLSTGTKNGKYWCDPVLATESKEIL